LRGQELIIDISARGCLRGQELNIDIYAMAMGGGNKIV
jgi:hypothetical protein